MSTIIHEPVITPTIADVLERAADLLGEYGWTQRAYAVADDGIAVDPGSEEAVAFCLWGAVMRAQRDLHGYVPAKRGKWLPSEGWNDEPERTKAEVVAKLRDVAVRAREAR